MQAISVGRLDHQIVCLPDRGRIMHQGVVVAAQIAGEDDRLPAPTQLHAGGAEDMPGATEHQIGPVSKVGRGVEIQRPQLLQRPQGVALPVKRQGRMVFRKAVAVREFRVALLYLGAVEQQEFAEVGRGRRAEHPTPEPLAHELRQIAGMVEVRVGEHHVVDRRRIDRESRPILQAQVLQSLEQAAVHKDAAPTHAKQMARSGDGPGGAQKRQTCLRHQSPKGALAQPDRVSPTPTEGLPPMIDINAAAVSRAEGGFVALSRFCPDPGDLSSGDEPEPGRHRRSTGSGGAPHGPPASARREPPPAPRYSGRSQRAAGGRDRLRP